MRATGDISGTLVGGATVVVVLLVLSAPGNAAAPFHGSYPFRATLLGGLMLQGPVGVAGDILGNIFVVDAVHSRVSKFSSTGILLAEWGSVGTGDGQFESPEAVAVDNSSGNVYVADSGNNRIQKFNGGGTFISAWGWGVTNGSNAFQVCTANCRVGQPLFGNGAMSSPLGIDTDVSGNVYVADTFNYRIQKFTSSGAYLAKWGSFGSGVNQVAEVYGLDVGATGDVYVADSGNNRLMRFSNTGTFVAAWGWGVTNGSSAYQVCTASCRPGLAGAGNGQFDFPTDVTNTPNGDVYVADYGNNRVERFAITGTYTSNWGGSGSGDGQFNEIYGLASPTGGSSFPIFVADYGNARVQKIDGSGVFQDKYGVRGSPPNRVNAPNDIAVSSSGTVYVADMENDRVARFDSTGSALSSWGTGGTGSGQFDLPAGVGVDLGGNVYVTDSQNNRVEKFNSAGTFVAAWGWGVTNGSSAYQVCTASCRPGIPGSGNGQMLGPRGLVVDSGSNVYVADSGNNRIQKFNSAGTFVSMWGWGVTNGSSAFQVCSTSCRAGISGSGNGQLSNVAGLGRDASNFIYAADSGNHRIQKFNSGGTFIAAWGTEGSGLGELESPGDVAADASGDVLVADSGNDRIQKFSAQGTPGETLGRSGNANGQFNTPMGVAVVGSSGDVYVADADNNRLQRFSWSPSTSTLSDLLTDYAGNQLRVTGTPVSNITGGL